MIAFLAGKVIHKSNSKVIIKTPSGIGYLVTISPSLKIMINEQVELFIYNAVRENISELFGFKDSKDLELNDKLLKVNGIGPKMSALIIYTLGYDTIIKALSENDSNAFVNVKGLGGKTAKKIILELKGEFNPDNDETKYSNSGHTEFSLSFTEALSNLGYKRSDIVRTITHLKKTKIWDESELPSTIRNGIKHLSKK